MIDKLNVALVVMLTAVTCSAFADQVKMPTQAEMKVASSAIRDLVSAGTSISELLSLAEETDSSAEMYCLYVEVFKAQAKNKQYADAATTIKRIKEKISGVPESEIVKLIDQHIGKSGNEIPELKTIYQLARSKMKAEKFVSQIKAALNKNPRDQYLQKSLGEALAISGDWESALNEFAKCGNEVSACAKAEAKGELTGKLAAFWWEYKADRRFGETGAFKAHAAELYSKLMDEDKLSVIERRVAEKRVSYVEELGMTIEEDVKQSENKIDSQIIANTNGLVHRWTFNDTLEDECGGFAAKIHGEEGCAEHKDGQITIFGKNHIYLEGKSIPTDGSPVTIELWARQNELSRWARIFAFGGIRRPRFEATWCWDFEAGNQQIFASNGCNEKESKLTPFTFGIEYHLAFVFFYKTDIGAKDNKAWYVRGYKQDVKTGKTLGMFEIKLKDGWTLKDFPSERFHLGLSYCGAGFKAKASYNEVRVWKRALTERELADNANRFYKAGETMKPMESITKSVSPNKATPSAFGTLMQ